LLQYGGFDVKGQVCNDGAMQKNTRSGQVGLLLLVIMGVVIALVMSVASRSLSDTVLSRQERESSAAFSVAETGIEKAMNEIKAVGGTQLGGTPITGSLTGLSNLVSGGYSVEASTNYGLFVKEGETAHLDLSTYVPTLTIAWTRKADPVENIATCTEGSGNAPAAIEISAFAGDTVTRSYYNPAGSGCNLSSNGFASSSDGGSTYRSMVTGDYSVPVGTTALRIKPLYTGATISVSGSNLEEQLYLIESQAQGGDAKKEIEVKRGLDAPPSIFDFAVFTAGTIVK
jgi:hypothetical protein